MENDNAQPDLINYNQLHNDGGTIEEDVVLDHCTTSNSSDSDKANSSDEEMYVCYNLSKW